MKKLKSLICGLLLSTCLAGNVFAGDFTGYGVLGFFDAALIAVVSVLKTPEPCEGRICTTCHPGSGGSESNGNCRPPSN